MANLKPKLDDLSSSLFHLAVSEAVDGGQDEAGLLVQFTPQGRDPDLRNWTQLLRLVFQDWILAA